MLAGGRWWVRGRGGDRARRELWPFGKTLSPRRTGTKTVFGNCSLLLVFTEAGAGCISNVDVYSQSVALSNDYSGKLDSKQSVLGISKTVSFVNPVLHGVSVAKNQ